MATFTTAFVTGCALDGDDPPPRNEPVACDTATTRAYRIGAIGPMSRSSDAFAAGLDVDGDDAPDNMAGVVLASMFSGFQDEDAEAAWAVQLGARLDGPLAWIVTISTCAGAVDTAADVQLRRGAMLADGRVRLVGEPGVPAAGVAIRGRITATGGRGEAPLGALADFTGVAPEGWHVAEGTTVDLTLLADGGLEGRIAGGFEPGYAEVVAASFIPFINPLIAAGNTVFGEGADLDGDGALTVAELLANRTFTVLMTPDIDLLDEGGAYHPGADGRNDAMSFGFAIRADEVGIE